MAWKKQTIYLTNGKRNFCRLCKCDMVLREQEFEMQQIGGSQQIRVKEVVLYCPSCKQCYITQAMSSQLVARHPGYYVDVSVYELKSAKKAEQNDTSNITSNQAVKLENTPSLEKTTSHQSQNHDSFSNGPSSTSNHTSESGMNIQVYITNSFSAANNICPLCCSVLGNETVNIPVIEQSGDFYRYYCDTVKYCYKCRKAYVSKDIVASILSRVTSEARASMAIKLENATVRLNENSREFLFAPTLNNTYAVFDPEDIHQKTGISSSDKMELSAQSFLGEMGYSVSKSISIRRRILLEAIKMYGKRRVCDHIAFLISTRRAQENGEKKYVNALHVWQEDINYISEI